MPLDFLLQTEQEAREPRRRGQQAGLGFLVDEPDQPQSPVAKMRARFPGLRRENWAYFAADEIQRMQEQRDATGSPRMSAAEQVAVQDAFRQMVGEEPVLAGRDRYREIRSKRLSEDQLANLGMSYLHDIGQATSQAVGVVAPEWAAEQGRKIEQTYMPQEGWGGTAGQVLAAATQAAPAIASGGAGALTQAGVLAGTFGAPGLGGVRSEVAGRRQGGEEISGLEEWAAGLGTAATEVLSGKVSQALAGVGGQAIGRALPQLTRVFQAGGRTALRKGIANLLRLQGAAAGEAVEEGLTQLTQNVIQRAAYAPERRPTEGLGEAAKLGYLTQHVLAPFSMAAGAGRAGVTAGQPQARPITPEQQPAGMQQGQPPSFEEQLNLMRNFIKDESVPDEAREIVQQRLEGAQERGQELENIDIPGLLTYAMDEAGQQQWRQTPLGQEAQRQMRWREEAPLLASAGVAPGQAPPTQAPGAAAPAPQGAQQAPQGAIPQTPEGRQQLAQQQADAPPPVTPESIQLRDPTGDPLADEMLRRQVAEEVNRRTRQAVEQPPQQPAAPPTPRAQAPAAPAPATPRQRLAQRQAQEARQPARQPAQQPEAEPGPAPLAPQDEGIPTFEEWVEDQDVDPAMFEDDPALRSEWERAYRRFVSARQAEQARAPERPAEPRTPQEAPRPAPQAEPAPQAAPGPPGRPGAAPPEPQPQAQQEPEGGVRLTEEQERIQAREREAAERRQQEARRAPREPSRQAGEDVESLFESAIAGNVTLEQAKSRLAETNVGSQEQALERLATDPTDNEALLGYISTQIGTLRNIAGRYTGAGADVGVDDLVQEGVAALSEALTQPVTRGKYKGMNRAQVLAETDAKPSSILFGRNSMVQTRMRRAAFPERGRQWRAGTETLRPAMRLGEIEQRQQLNEEEPGYDQELQRRRQALRQTMEGEEGPELSTETEQVAEQARRMLAEGASEEDVRKFVAEQQEKGNVHFLPWAAEAVRQGQTPRPAGATRDAAVRDAVAKVRSAGVRIGRPVEPVTREEQAAQDWAAARGVRAVFVDEADFLGAELETDDGARIVLMRSGLGRQALWETVGHESAHALDLDQLPVGDEKLLRRAEREYLKASPEKMRKLLEADPERLRREAVATLYGEVLADPRARARLEEQAPTLWGRIWQSLKNTLRSLAEYAAGAPRQQKAVIEQVLENFRQVTTVSATRQDVAMLPDPTTEQHPVIQKLIDESGITKDPYEAQFITPDGRFIAKEPEYITLHAERLKHAGMKPEGEEVSNELRETGLLRVGRFMESFGPGGDTAYIQTAHTITARQARAIQRLTRGADTVVLEATRPRGDKKIRPPIYHDVLQQPTGADVASAIDDLNSLAQQRMVDFMPDPQRKYVTDAQQFVDELKSVMAESPKETGRPELANPMDTEATRRLVDTLDGMLEKQNKPERQSEEQWRREAKTLLRRKKGREQVTRMVKAGGQLSPAETIAAKQVLREEGEDVLQNPTLSKVLSIQELGMGWREGGTEQARAMRARYDEIKRPAERVREFVTGAIATLPSDVKRKVDKLKEQGKESEADKLRQQHGERVVELLERWRKDGIDPAVLDDATAADPATLARIDRDLRRLQPVEGWDVVHEIRRNFLMYAPKTMIRNGLGGFYSVADVFVTKPLARSLRSLVQNSKGETGAAWHAFGSEMVVGKALQNAALSIMYEVPVLESQLRAATGEKLVGAAQAEIHSPPAITGQTARQAIEQATSVLGGGGSAAMRAGKAAEKLVGGLGRMVRAPQAINMATDEIFKTMHLYSEVAAWAVRIGKAKGLQPGTSEMQQFVDEQLQDMGSEAFGEAVASGESWRVTFQGDAGAFERFILRLTSKRAGTVGNVLRMFVPFRKSPVQLPAQALMHVPGVGSLRMAQRALESKKGGKPYTADEATRHIAQQLIGLMGAALIWNLTDDEDEDAAIRFTGPASYARRHRQERVTREQAEPYMSVRIGGKWHNYNYVEPFSQWLGTLAAFSTEMKRSAGKGDTARPSDTAMRLWHRVAGMYSDQTYIRTLGDMMKAAEDPEYYASRIGVNFAGSWLPNFVDAALRDNDPFIRERRIMGVEAERPGFVQRVKREMFPTEGINPPPKVDFFGNEISVPGQLKNPRSMFMLRLLSPIQPRYTVKGKQADVLQMLMNWNADKEVGHPDPNKRPRWFQEPYRKVTVRYPNVPEPVREDMNETEYHLYARLSGLLAAREVEKRDWNVQNPTQQDIRRLETIFSETRDAAREYVTAARQAKALDRMGDYRQAMRRLRAKIREAEERSR